MQWLPSDVIMFKVQQQTIDVLPTTYVNEKMIAHAEYSSPLASR